MKSKVICLRPKHDFDRAGIEMPASFDVQFYPKADEEELTKVCADADVILTSSTYPPITTNIIARARSLKLIQLTGSGYNTVDLAAADKAGVPVARMPGQNSRSVAQFAFVLMSVLGWGILEGDAETKKGNYEEVREKIRQQGAYELEGKVWGSWESVPVARRWQKSGRSSAPISFTLTLSVFPRRGKGIKAHVCRFRHAPYTSDILTFHLPLTQETRTMIGSRELGLMKPTAILINTSRGGIVDEDALLDAFRSDRLKGAALDVFEPEPIPGPSLLVSR